ncbi:MAG: phosphatidate cytidylyltransferase [Candidatus Omnitrophica bacterium]|nr:phosphatidate cytidylyltransferase [Candidatus Omnitrophota bacterium]
MKQRLITSAILILLTIAGLVFQPLFAVLVNVIIALGLLEFFNMVEKKGVKLFKYFGLAIGLFIGITVYFRFPIKEGWQFLFIIWGLFSLFLLELTKKDQYQPILSLSATTFGIIYIAWCFSFLLRIRQLQDGLLLCIFLITVTKASDIGAYFIGKRFGRTSLIKRVSPQKSLEGALGGFLISLAVGVVFSFFLQELMFFWEKVFMSAILAIISQLGDLFESLIKRDCNTKDSGAIFPGMGGILDVIDSLIFTAPTFYLYVTMVR